MKCRRILLARKTIFCKRPLAKEQAIDEVAHLTRLRHSHIVRVIGTYTLGKELSILMYPVADYNLEDFLDQTPNCYGLESEPSRLLSMESSFRCLVSAIYTIHTSLIKHMDIKPQNILVRRQWQNPVITNIKNIRYHIYLTDFGISRSYEKLEDAETDGPTSYTRKYAAREVVEDDTRGFPADIFSLGCVFLEIALYIYDITFPDSIKKSARTHLQELLIGDKTRGPWYYAHTNRIDQYLNTIECTGYRTHLLISRDLISIIQLMMADDPQVRPTAKALYARFPPRSCCLRDPLPFEATN